MSDNFDIKLERKLERKADGRGSDVADVRRIELITGTGRRRRWSSEDKANIVGRRQRIGGSAAPWADPPTVVRVASRGQGFIS